MTRHYDGLGFLLRQDDKWWLCRSASDNPIAYVKLEGNTVQAMRVEDEDPFNPWQPLALGRIGPIAATTYTEGFARIRGLEYFTIYHHNIVDEQKDRFFGSTSAIVLADVSAKHEGEAFTAGGFDFCLFDSEAISAMYEAMGEADYMRRYFQLMLAQAHRQDA
ncbi:hypothetical protein JNJ66_01270 [Candidatus Saccharibacteria bacterium]|nr:hypothetical protein [Candidatus Saccharibacteria bacterium]